MGAAEVPKLPTAAAADSTTAADFPELPTAASAAAVLYSPICAACRVCSSAGLWNPRGEMLEHFQRRKRKYFASYSDSPQLMTAIDIVAEFWCTFDLTGTKCKQNVFGGKGDPSQYLLQPP